MLIRSICIVVMLHGSCAVKLKRRTHASHNAAVLAAVIDATASTYERVDEPGKAASDILLFHAPCPALRPDQRTAIENLSALVQKFFGGGIRSIELGTALHALPDMGVYSDLTRKIVTAVSMNDINEIVALFVGNAGGAIVRSVPWACLASIGLLWTVFTSLMYACTELHPKALPTHNVTQSYPDLVLYPPFHVSVFGVFEQATGFDYRLCAKFFVNPWHVTEKSDAAEGGVADCERWAYTFFPDDRYAFPKSFSLTGLFDLRNQTVVADRREKWPFGETYVYVPEKGSPAARYDDYLGKVYGNDWTTTLRERDAKTTDEPLMRQFIHRVTNHSAFYGVVAQPTGPLYPPLTAEPSFREKRYDWPPLA